jgi:hypothetical protein
VIDAFFMILGLFVLFVVAVWSLGFLFAGVLVGVLVGVWSVL